MSKQLPARPHRFHLNKQAKQLLKGHQSGTENAIRRIKAMFPKLHEKSEAQIAAAEFCLQDAKFVVAREYGYTTWQELLADVPISEQGSDATDGAAILETSSPEDVTYVESDLIPVTIDVYPADAEAMQGIERITVLLAAPDGRVVVISIGTSEGQALARALQDRPPARPLAYNLLNEMMTMFGGTMERLVIHSLEKEVYYAHLLLRKDDGERAMDCRPSDGMVMAVENKAPVFVTSSVMEKVGQRSTKEEVVKQMEEYDREAEQAMLEAGTGKRGQK